MNENHTGSQTSGRQNMYFGANKQTLADDSETTSCKLCWYLGSVWQWHAPNFSVSRRVTRYIEAVTTQTTWNIRKVSIFHTRCIYLLHMTRNEQQLLRSTALTGLSFNGRSVFRKAATKLTHTLFALTFTFRPSNPNVTAGSQNSFISNVHPCT
jgi:hypothetical protein